MLVALCLLLDCILILVTTFCLLLLLITRYVFTTLSLPASALCVGRTSNLTVIKLTITSDPTKSSSTKCLCLCSGKNCFPRRKLVKTNRVFFQVCIQQRSSAQQSNGKSQMENTHLMGRLSCEDRLPCQDVTGFSSSVRKAAGQERNQIFY